MPCWKEGAEEKEFSWLQHFPCLLNEGGLSRYLDEIRKFPMLEPSEEFMLAKRWREQGDRDAAHKLVTCHLRLVAKIAMGYRGYGLPIGEVVSEGNVGLMQAVKRFEPDKGFRLATYAMWWIKAAIQEYILRSWSLVKMGTTANQKKLFFNLRKAKGRISALEEGDLHPDHVKTIAKQLGVNEQDVVDMNRRLGGDASLNSPSARGRRRRVAGLAGGYQREPGGSCWSRKRRDRTASRPCATRCRCSILANAAFSRRGAFRTIRSRSKIFPTEFGVSRERVSSDRRIRAFEKIQEAVKKESRPSARGAAPPGSGLIDDGSPGRSRLSGMRPLRSCPTGGRRR